MAEDTELKRAWVGAFWVDTAMVLVGDPCQVLQNEDCTKPAPTYKELIDKFFPSHPRGERVDEILAKQGPTTDELREALDLIQRPPMPTAVSFQNTHGDAGSFALQTGTDGWYHVYKEYNSNGVVRIIIECGKVDPHETPRQAAEYGLNEKITGAKGESCQTEKSDTE